MNSKATKDHTPRYLFGNHFVSLGTRSQRIQQTRIVAGKAGENTWNSRLAEGLRKKGFSSADFEIHFPILRGRPRKPDVAFVNGGTHLISGKLGENKEFDAFSSAQEYQQLISTTTSLGEVFGVVYPSTKRESFIVHLLANTEHERQVWRFHDFSDVVEIIYEVVQKRINYLKRPVEPPDASVVRLLRQGVEVLHIYAKKANEQRLKEVFGGADFFDSVLSEYVQRNERKTVLSRAASFLFVNQILFYSILRRETRLYPAIDVEDMSSPLKIRSKYFAQVLQKDYRPIFEIDVASLFDPETSMDGCLRVTRLIQDLVRSVSTHDLIGKVFHEIIPLEFRKVVAAFYTNSAAADLLAALSISDPDAHVLDPACGSGTLLVSAYHRKRMLAMPEREKRIELHKKFVQKQITGLDVMAFSAHLAAVQLLLQEPLQYTDLLRIATVDTTQLYLGKKIEPFGETIREAFHQRRIEDFESGKHEIKPSEIKKLGAVKLDYESRESFELTSADVVLMNPPFTSAKRMSKIYRDKLKNRFRKDLRYAKLVKGNVGYHLYFICLADKFLVNGGRMAIVMPFTTLGGGDFGELTKFLVSKYSIEYVICGSGRSAFSENTQLTEILFVARKEPPVESHRSVLLLTKTSPISWSQENVDSILSIAKKCTTTGKQMNTKLCKAVHFNQNELLPERKTLTRLVADLDEDYKSAGYELDQIIEDCSFVTTFEQLIKSNVLQLKVAEVVHGKSSTNEGHSLTRFGGDALVAFRTEERALMKHDRLIYDGETKSTIKLRDKSTGDIFEVPRNVIGAALRRFAHINKFEITNQEDLVITHEFQGVKNLFTSILGDKKALDALAAVRKEWDGVVKSGSSSLCLPGNIDLTAPGTKVIASCSDKPIFMCSFMWGISGLTKSDEKIIVLWLNSAIFFHLLLARRTVTRGSWVKLHGKQLRRMSVIDPTKLPLHIKSRLVKLYDELFSFEWSSIVSQYDSPPKERVKLDMEILKALGVTDVEKTKKIMELLYDANISALRTMQTTMEAD